MTPTSKEVQRVTVKAYRVLYTKSRPIVVRLAQGDLLRFREKGRRLRFDLPIDVAFGIAVKAAAGYRICIFPGPAPSRRRKQNH